jgi:phosphoribosyl 1,2-cyclic phosphodiesterase
LVAQGEQSVLIDCGFSRKNLIARLTKAQSDPTAILGLLVTHEHSDHAKGALSVCEGLDIPLYSSYGTAVQMDWVAHELWKPLHADEPLKLGAFHLLPVTVPHDAREPLQFVVQNQLGCRLGVLSDLGCVTPHIYKMYRQCHGLQLEANHDPQMLRNGPYPPMLQRRVAGDFGHLSNLQTAELLSKLLWSGLQQVSAGHISEKNNDPGLVANVMAQVLGCDSGHVQLLDQDEVSDWFELRV